MPLVPSAEVQAFDTARVNELRRMVETIMTEGNAGVQLRALAELRRSLAASVNPPIQEALEAGAAAALPRCLAAEVPAAAALEAAWVLTTLASGSSAETAALLSSGAGEALLAALQHPALEERADLCDQILWALANIAADSDLRMRDHLLAAGAVNMLGYLFSRMPSFSWSITSRTQVLRTKTWLLSSLCRGSPAPPPEEVECLFDYFVQVLLGTDDARMLADAMWGLCYLVGGAADEAETIARFDRILGAGYSPAAVPLEHPVIEKVVSCIGRAGDCQNPLPVPALQLISSMLRLSHAQYVDTALAAGALPALTAVLLDACAPEALRRDAAWALANVAAGTAAQTKALLDVPEAWSALCTGMEQASSKLIRRECAWAVANVTKRAYGERPGQPDPREVLQLLTRVLKQDSFDAALSRALLDAAEVALRCGEELAQETGGRESALAALAEDAGLVEELEGLKHGSEASVSRKAAHLLETYFGHRCDEAKPASAKDDKAHGGRARSSIAGDASPTRKRAYQFGA